MERFVESLGKERRLAERHELRTQVRLRVRSSTLCEQEVKSENISRRGVFFTTDLPLTEGTILDLLLEMPEAISGVRAAHWNCMGHVVRVVPAESENHAVGIGVEFDFYVVSHGAKQQWASGPGLRGPLKPSFNDAEPLANLGEMTRSKLSGTH